MDNLDLSEEEIRQQLVDVGYTDFPKQRLQEFKQDLEELIQNGGLPSPPTSSVDANVKPGPPAFTKEIVSPRDFDTSPASFSPLDEIHNTQVLIPSAQKDGRPQQHRGSETPYTLVPDTRGRHYITRKVSRKIDGQSVICDESYYKQDSDRELLIQNSGLPSTTSPADPMLKPRPPAFTKEIVSPRDFDTSPASFSPLDEIHNTQVLIPSAQKDGRPQQHRSSETPYTLVPDTRDRHYITRKVSRKIDGQSVICDESYYKQDSDRELLIQNSGLPSTTSPSADPKLKPRPPAFTKEIVSPRDLDTFPRSFSPHDKGRNTQVLSPNVQKDGRMQQRLHEGGETPPILLPDTQGGRLVTRKVLRKVDGQSVVFDESYYRPDSELEQGSPVSYSRQETNMYRMCQDQDESSFSSSLWSSEEEAGIDGYDSTKVQTGEDASDEDTGTEDDGSVFHSEKNGNEEDARSDGTSVVTSGYGTFRPEDQHVGEEQDSCAEGSQRRYDKEDAGSRDSFYDDSTHGSEDDERDNVSHGDPKEPENQQIHVNLISNSMSEDVYKKLWPKPEDCDHNIRSEDEKKTEDLHNDNKNDGEMPETLSHDHHHKNDCEDTKIIVDHPNEIHPDTQSEIVPGEDGQNEVIPDLNSETSRDDEGLGHIGDEKFLLDKVDFMSGLLADGEEHTKNCDKIFRRHDSKEDSGKKITSEEKFVSIESLGNLTHQDCSSLLQYSLSGLHIHDSENDKSSLSNDMVGISLSSFGSGSTRSTRSGSESDLRTKHKSFIRPIMTQRTIKKMDPVTRYFQYKQLWDEFKLPGERDHRELRWEIRERLAYQPIAPKARRTYVANSYVVPTEKKRSALRWQVRNQMAHPDPPHVFSYRF